MKQIGKGRKTSRRNWSVTDGFPLLKFLFVALVFASAATAFGKNLTFYWIGENGASFHDKSNWALANGAAASAYPSSADTVVFTNTTALSLSVGADTYVDTYRFDGSGDVTLGRQTYNLRNATGSGGIFATGSGNYNLDYTVDAPATLGEYPIEVAKGASVCLSSYGTTKINNGATLVKRGPGDFHCGGMGLNWCGALRLEQGTTKITNGVGGRLAIGPSNSLQIVGAETKKLFVNGDAGSDLKIANYSESADAVSTFTFEGYRKAGANVTLSGASEQATRFSADFYNELGVFNLIWNPQTNATLDIVRREYNQDNSSIQVRSGKVRLTEEASVTNLKEIRIATNATLEVASDAGTIGTGAPMVVEEGGTLVVGKTYLPGSKLTWNGTVRLESGTFPAHNGKVNSNPKIGATADLVLAGTAAKTHYVYGNASLTFRNYEETPEAEGTGTLAVYTGSDPTLTFKGTKDTRFSANVDNTAYGKYTLCWQPVGNQAMSVVKRTYEDGQIFFKAASGTLRVAEGAAFKSTGGVTIEAGATLAIATDAGLDWSKTPLTLAEGAVTAFEGDVALRVKTLTIGETLITDGIYTKANASWITGDGAVVVGAGTPAEPETVEMAWVGAGTTGAIGEAANWGGTLPDLTNGSLLATFPDGASIALPGDGSVCFKGIVAQGALMLSGGAFRIGSSGIATAGNGKSVVIDAPVLIYAPQTWTVGANDRLSFTANGAIGSAWPRSIGKVSALTWTGANDNSVIELKASSPELWNVDSTVHVEARADNSLGGFGTAFTAKKRERIVRLYGNSFANDFIDYDDNSSTSPTLFNIFAGDNVILGKVSGLGANNQYWHFDNTSGGKASITFRGGYTYSSYNNNSCFSPIHNGRVTFEDVPFDVTRIWIGYRNYYSNTLNLNVASNRTTRGIILNGWSVMNTTVRDALYATDDGSSGVVMNPDTTWNLSADQSVNVLSVNGSPKISSDVGATLTLRDDRLNNVKPTEALVDEGDFRISLRTDIVQTNAAVFAGNVNFVKAGALDLYLDGVSTTTGDLTVRNGKVIFRNGSWKNAARVTLSGGKIRFENRALSRGTDIVVEGGETAGAIEIPAGVTVRCKSLTVNGEAVDDGRLETGVVTGGGCLAVGKIGFRVIVR